MNFECPGCGYVTHDIVTGVLAIREEVMLALIDEFFGRLAVDARCDNCGTFWWVTSEAQGELFGYRTLGYQARRRIRDDERGAGRPAGQMFIESGGSNGGG